MAKKKLNLTLPPIVQWIIDGVVDLRSFIERNNVHSIAKPPLGAGNGGLKWDEVKPHITQILRDLENVEIIVYRVIKLLRSE